MIQWQQEKSIENSILIVDDDEAVTQTFARMLELEGYAVRTAVNAETGLAGRVRAHA